MKILGIESSCDETAASVVEDGKYLLSNVVHTQIDIHKQYGGVIPEIAARNHIETITPVINKALSDASLEWNDIDAIAVTYSPGLLGSLLIGVLSARTYAIVKNKPLYPIHHVEAHVYSNFLIKPPNVTNINSSVLKTVAKLADQQPRFPLLALIVSGGHTQIVLFKNHGDYTLIGQTADDAVGEAFDKVAKIIGLPYPGGPSIEKVAMSGDPNKFKLPIANMKQPYDFSFSGLKTAVLRQVQTHVGVDIKFPSFELANKLSDQDRADFAASFQYTAIKTLVNKMKKAYEEYSPKSIVIAGGVAANLELRRQLEQSIPININYVPIELCTDNAAMVATLAYYQSSAVSPTDPFTLEVSPSLSMTKTSWNKQTIDNVV